MENVSLRDKLLAWVSIIFVVLIFLFQAGIIYSLFQTNMNLLTRELNLVTDEVYTADLNKRLDAGKRDTKNNIQFKGTDDYSGKLDTLQGKKVVYFNGKEASNSETQSSPVAILNLAIEEFISKTHSINLSNLKTEVEVALKRNNINLHFYIEVVDLTTNKVLDTTLPATLHPSSILSSKDMPLNIKQTKVFRVVLIEPMSKIYPQMAWMLVLSLLLSLVCIYCLYFQLKTLSKQRKLAHLKSDFFSEVSHEFKRPLSVLKQAVSSLDNEKIIVEKDRRSRLLKIADQEIVKMTEKTEMLLSLAMDDEGIFEVNKTELDLVKIVYDLADEALDTTTKPIDVDIENELKFPHIVADQAHIEQVISNLLGNAIKYSKAAIDIRIKMYEEGAYTCISIKDNGLGIAVDDLRLIFNKYTRVAKTTNIKGHGIGLNYVKRIVEKHKGIIDVSSEVNVGSVFTIKLPTNG